MTAALGRPDQIATIATKSGAWHTWLVLAAAAPARRAPAPNGARQGPSRRPLARRARSHRLVGDAIGQVRSVMSEGLWPLVVHPSAERQRSRLRANQLSAQRTIVPDVCRVIQTPGGPQFDAAWCDELARWRRPDVAWDTAAVALRLGELPAGSSSPPRAPIPLLKAIMDDHATAISRSPHRDKRQNLAAAFWPEDAAAATAETALASRSRGQMSRAA